MRKAIVLASSVGTTLFLPVFAFAEQTGTANSDVVTAMTGVANDMVATGNAMIPVALTVVGIALVVVFGIRIFKKIVNK